MMNSIDHLISENDDIGNLIPGNYLGNSLYDEEYVQNCL
jgi:hypothetical protein